MATYRIDGINQKRMDLKLNRKEEADERAIVRETISPEKQIAILDLRLGKGVGAAKERARLNKQIVAA